MSRWIDRLTALDRLMLEASRRWPQDIGALAILDGATLHDPAGELRIDAVREAIASRLHLVPRFRQVLHLPRRARRTTAAQQHHAADRHRDDRDHDHRDDDPPCPSVTSAGRASVLGFAVHVEITPLSASAPRRGITQVRTSRFARRTTRLGHGPLVPQDRDARPVT